MDSGQPKDPAGETRPNAQGPQSAADPASGPVTRLKRSLLDRLARYHICLHDTGFLRDSEFVSSARIAEYLEIDDTQVRKDLAVIGVRGRPNVGYVREEMMIAVHQTLGLDLEHRAVIVGAGRLGGAIAEYGGFREYGLRILGLFDSDPAKVGSRIGGVEVFHVSQLGQLIEDLGARLAILTCPAGAAQEAANAVVKHGVSAVWNFAPTNIAVPSHVAVRNEHIFAGLAELTHVLKIQGDLREASQPDTRG